MTRLIARLVLAMMILPLSGTVFVLFLGLLALRPSGPTVDGLAMTWLAVYAFIAIYWIALWRSMIRWTRERKINTGLSALAALLIGASLGVVFRNVFGVPIEPALLVGGGVVPIVWVLATVLIWRETPKERLERLSAAGTDAVSCPVCGYNMTGLREALCPECGARFTLDQLLTAQPHRDAASLPREPSSPKD